MRPRIVDVLKQAHAALLLEPFGIRLPWSKAEAVARGAARAELQRAIDVLETASTRGPVAVEKRS